MKLKEGTRIFIPDRGATCFGIIKYIGPTKLGEGTWVGIELDLPTGENDGSVNGTRYFECKPKHGVFIPRSQCVDKKGGRSRNQRSEEKLPDSASIADSQLSSSPSVVVKSSRPEDGTLELAHTSPGSVSSYSTSRSKGSRRLEGDAGRAEISHFRNLTHDQLVQRLHRTMEERAKVFHQRNELKKEIPNLLKEAQKWKTWAEKERETRQKLEDEVKAHSSRAETTSKHEEEMAAVSKELAEIRQALSDAKQENEALKAEVQTLRDQREELEDKMLEDDKAQSLEMKKKESALNDAMREKKRLEKSLRVLEAELEDQKDLRVQADRKAAAASDELSRIEEENKNLLQQREAEEKKTSRLQEELEELSSKLQASSATEQKSAELSQQVAALQSRVEVFEAEKQRFLQDFEALNAQIRGSEAAAATLQQEKESLQEENRGLKEDVERMRGKLQEANNALAEAAESTQAEAEMGENLEDLMREVEQLQWDLEEAQKVAADAQAEAARHQTEANTLREQLDELGRETEEQMKEDRQGVERQLTQALREAKREKRAAKEASEEAQALKKRNESMRDTIRKLQAELREANGRVSRITAELNQEGEGSTALEERLKSVRADNARLQREISQAKGEVSRVKLDNLELRHSVECAEADVERWRLAFEATKTHPDSLSAEDLQKILDHIEKVINTVRTSSGKSHKEAEIEAEDHARRVEKLELAIEKARQEVEEAKDGQAKAAREAKAAAARVAGLEQEKNALVKSVQELESRMQELEEEKADLNAELRRLVDANQDLVATLEDADGDMGGLASELRSARSEAAHLRRELKATTRRAQKKEEALQLEIEELHAVVSSSDDVEGALKIERSRSVALQREVSDYQSEVANLQQKLDATMKELESLRDTNRKLEAEANELRSTVRSQAVAISNSASSPRKLEGYRSDQPGTPSQAQQVQQYADLQGASRQLFWNSTQGHYAASTQAMAQQHMAMAPPAAPTMQPVPSLEALQARMFASGAMNFPPPAVPYGAPQGTPMTSLMSPGHPLPGMPNSGSLISPGASMPGPLPAASPHQDHAAPSTSTSVVQPEYTASQQQQQQQPPSRQSQPSSPSPASTEPTVNGHMEPQKQQKPVQPVIVHRRPVEEPPDDEDDAAGSEVPSPHSSAMSPQPASPLKGSAKDIVEDVSVEPSEGEGGDRGSERRTEETASHSAESPSYQHKKPVVFEVDSGMTVDSSKAEALYRKGQRFLERRAQRIQAARERKNAAEHALAESQMEQAAEAASPEVASHPRRVRSRSSHPARSRPSAGTEPGSRGGSDATSNVHRGTSGGGTSGGFGAPKKPIAGPSPQFGTKRRVKVPSTRSVSVGRHSGQRRTPSVESRRGPSTARPGGSSEASSFHFPPAAPVPPPSAASPPNVTGPLLRNNHNRVRNALSHLLMAGPHQAQRLQDALAALDDARQQIVVIAFTGSDNERGPLAGIYAMDKSLAHGTRIHGVGPPEFDVSAIATYMKFDTAGRKFRKLGSSGMTVTTDAVTLDKAVLSSVYYQGNNTAKPGGDQAPRSRSVSRSRDAGYRSGGSIGDSDIEFDFSLRGGSRENGRGSVSSRGHPTDIAFSEASATPSDEESPQGIQHRDPRRSATRSPAKTKRVRVTRVAGRSIPR